MDLYSVTFIKGVLENGGEMVMHYHRNTLVNVKLFNKNGTIHLLSLEKFNQVCSTYKESLIIDTFDNGVQEFIEVVWKNS